MKSSVANVWLLGIVLVFILLFSAYIVITVDYSQSFKLKNTVLTIIEKNRGVTNSIGSTKSVQSVTGRTETLKVNVGTIQTINLYLNGNAYTAKGACPDDGATWYGIKSLDYKTTSESTLYDKKPKGDDYYYCISKYGTGLADIKFSSGKTYNSAYYKVRLFYKFEVPVLSDFFSVKIEGITDEIYRPLSDILPTNSEYYASI